MKISRCTKAYLYLGLAIVLIVISAVLQVSMHKPGELEHAYFQSNQYLFIAAATFLGIAVYSYRSYTRRHTEHKRESVLFLCTGLILMIVSVFSIINYGGLSDIFQKAGYTAANINIVVLTILPLPFMVRAFILAFSKREEKSKTKTAAIVLCIATAAMYVTLMITGSFMRMVYFDESSQLPNGNSGNAPYSEEQTEEKSV